MSSNPGQPRNNGNGDATAPAELPSSSVIPSVATAAPDSSQLSKDAGGSNTALVVGACVAAAVALVVIGVAGFYFLKRRRTKLQDTRGLEELKWDSGDTTAMTRPSLNVWKPEMVSDSGPQSPRRYPAVSPQNSARSIKVNTTMRAGIDSGLASPASPIPSPHSASNQPRLRISNTYTISKPQDAIVRKFSDEDMGPGLTVIDHSMSFSPTSVLRQSPIKSAFLSDAARMQDSSMDMSFGTNFPNGLKANLFPDPSMLGTSPAPYAGPMPVPRVLRMRNGESGHVTSMKKRRFDGLGAMEAEELNETLRLASPLSESFY